MDRLWPRGVTKEKADIREWLRDLAPGDGLRKQFHDHPEKWDEFKQRYFEELAKPEKKPRLEQLVNEARSGMVTPVYAARDEQHNNANALKEYLERLIQ